MSGNFLNVGKNTYELLDHTVVSPHDFVRSLYHFKNQGARLMGGRFIDDHCVTEALISADSFSDAIKIFEDEMPLDRDGQAVTIEYIGCDNRERCEDAVIMHLIKCP